MTNIQLTKLLTDIGLREVEAKTYLAALSLGPTTVLRLARSTDIKRTTLYSVIDELQRQGLLTIEVRGFKKFFVATSPERLEFILDQRRATLRTALPDLAAMYNLKGGESFLKYYQGLDAVKTVYESLIRDIRPHEDYLIMSEFNQWLSQDYHHFMDFIRRRAKLPINIRLLLEDSPAAREHKKLERTFNETVKFLPHGTSLSTNLVITPQRVLIHQVIPPIFGIVIENKSVIQMHREQFEIMWRALP